MSEQADIGCQGDIPGQNRCAYCGVKQTFPVSVSTPELLNRHPSKGRHAWGIKETSYTRIDASWELGGCWRRNTQRNRAISQMRLGTMGVLVSQVRVDTLGLLCRQTYQVRMYTPEKHSKSGKTHVGNQGVIPGQTDILGELEGHHSQGRHTWVIRDITDQNRHIWRNWGTSQIIVNIPW